MFTVVYKARENKYSSFANEKKKTKIKYTPIGLTAFVSERIFKSSALVTFDDGNDCEYSEKLYNMTHTLLLYRQLKPYFVKHKMWFKRLAPVKSCVTVVIYYITVKKISTRRSGMIRVISKIMGTVN